MTKSPYDEVTVKNVHMFLAVVYMISVTIKSFYDNLSGAM